MHGRGYDAYSITVIYGGAPLRRNGMPKDPMSLFGRNLATCVNDEYETREKGAMRDGVALAFLGVACSVLTTYLLASVGLLV